MRHTQPLTVIGIGGRFPGGASSPDTFWELLCSGVDAIRDIPPERWDLRRFYAANPEHPGKTYAGQGGFLHEREDYLLKTMSEAIVTL